MHVRTATMYQQRVPTMKKLLVIDDERVMTRAVQQVAEALGFSVRVLNEPIRTIEEFIDFQPDVVVLDMVMPEEDGLDLLDELLLTGIPTRFVLICEFGRAYIRLAERIAQFHRAEIAAVVHKPFRRGDLARTLTRLVDDIALMTLEP